MSTDDLDCVHSIWLLWLNSFRKRDHARTLHESTADRPVAKPSARMEKGVSFMYCSMSMFCISKQLVHTGSRP